MGPDWYWGGTVNADAGGSSPSMRANFKQEEGDMFLITIVLADV